jgi:hypothetical protein
VYRTAQERTEQTEARGDVIRVLVCGYEQTDKNIRNPLSDHSSVAHLTLLFDTVVYVISTYLTYSFFSVSTQATENECMIPNSEHVPNSLVPSFQNRSM